ncbi:MAG: type II secretion system protein GspG [Planctomycetota bacterium]
MSMHAGADWDPDNKPSNPLAPVGLFLSFCLSPLGLLLSIIALAFNPKGLAIAGVVVGLIGTAVWAVVIYGMVVIGGTFTQMLQIAQETGEDLKAQREALVATYEADGAFPDSFEGLALTEEDRTDYWGNEYRYEVVAGGENYVIRSAGKDGSFDTDDDVIVNRYTPVEMAVPITQDFFKFAERAAGGEIEGFSRTMSDMAMLTSAIQEHEERTGSKPATLGEIPGLTPEMRTDFWGTEYGYELRQEGQSFGLWSKGPNGETGGGDDATIDSDGNFSFMGGKFQSSGSGPWGKNSGSGAGSNVPSAPEAPETPAESPASP